MSARLRAVADLFHHYGEVFTAVWRIRKELDTPVRMKHELAFLPTTLELVDTPVHPAPRWTMMLLSGLAVLAATLAFVGNLDIVVSAHGKIIPNARVKIVQPAVAGVIRRIHVKDGQVVSEGEPLIDLDPTQATADESKVHSTKSAAALAEARAQALLQSEQQGKLPTVTKIEGVTDIDHGAAQRLAVGVFREYQDKQITAQAILRRREAELESTRSQIAKLKATSPLARQQAADYQALVERRYVTKTDYLDKESNALQQEHELQAQISHARELEAAVATQRAELSSLASQFRREQLDMLDKARQQLSQSRDEETKAQTRRAFMNIKAPTSGTIQQLSVHTVGGVVSAAQTLMEVVPDDAIEVEAFVENKDVGFIKPGQEVEIKVDAFPYTRYGTLRGVVRHVSTNAVQDRRSGLSFIVHIQIQSAKMKVSDQLLSLTAGMTVTADVRTGRRTVATYFFDPFMQTAQESLRER